METEKTVRNTLESGKGLIVDTIIPGLITLVLSAVIIYIIRAFLIKSLRRSDKMEEKQKVRLVKTVTTALAIIAIIIVVSGYGLQTGSLVAMIGVAGLSLSLALQGLLSNFFSGCVLPLTKPFREGDVIDAVGVRGIIRRIGYFNTTLVTLENITVVIPNSVLTSGCIINYSTMETLKVEQTFSVDPDMADEEVRTAIREAIGKDPRILTDPEPEIRIEAFDSMGTSYNVKIPCKSGDYNDVSHALIENVYASFKEHSIEMGSCMMSMRGGSAGGGMGGMGSGMGGGMGGSRGRGGQQSGGMGGGRGGSGQQSGGAGSGRGGSAQQSGDADSSRGESGQPSGGAGGSSEGNGQQPGGAGGGRGGSGKPSGSTGGRGGKGQPVD